MKKHFNEYEKEKQLIAFYRDECARLVALIREISGPSATRQIAKALDISTQAVHLRFSKKESK